MDIKMIVADMDGTLLTSEKTISDYTKKVLAEKQREGIIVAYATARPYRVTENYFDVLTPDIVSAHNGGVLYHHGKVVLNHGIPKKDALKMIANLQDMLGNPRLDLEIGEVIYRNGELPSAWAESPNVLTDFSDLPDNPIDKIIIYKESLAAVVKDQSFLTENTYLQVIEGVMGAVLNKKATKENAVKDFSSIFDIPMESIACFGDDLNDISMIESVGYGVAMGNALDEVKNAARFVCGTNDEDGLAKWISQNV